MERSESNGVSARLWKLPGQLLLALINATAILIIAAAILVLVVMARIGHFAGDVAATMTDAVLSEVELPPQEVLGNLQKLTAEVHALGQALGEIKPEENQIVVEEIKKLKDALNSLNISVSQLANARSLLTDEAVKRLGEAVTEMLMKLRNCAAESGQHLGSLTPIVQAPSGKPPEPQAASHASGSD